MNLILFEPAEIGHSLARSDPRAEHLLKVLSRKEGDLFDAGVVNGKRGKGTIRSIGPAFITFDFEGTADPSPEESLHLLLALARPQTARKILGAATSLGVASLRFFPSEKGEPGYATSTLWTGGEWRRHLLEGAAQAFDTRIPDVLHFGSLAEAADSTCGLAPRIALDNYEAARRFGDGDRSAAVLAFGPERGWSAQERTLLRSRGFELAHLGSRVLRTETAVVAAVAIAKVAG